MTPGRHSVSVTLLPRLEEIAIARGALDSLARAQRLSGKATARLQIVLDELVSNAITHGRGDPPCDATMTVEVDMEIKDRVFVLCITDGGAAFDPSAHAFEDPSDRPKIGGRGLDMVRGLTDSFRHIRTDDGKNQTTVTKALEPQNEGDTPMIAGLEIEETRAEGKATVTLKGRIDSGNASQLTDHLSSLVEAGHPDLTLDMGHLNYLTSAGFRTLLVISDATENLGGGLTLTSMTEEVRELFDLSGLSKAFVIK